MGSRIRKDVTRLFECFCEVVGPSKEHASPWILQIFPEHYKQDERLKIVPNFTYPCDFDKTIVQHFSFILTNIESQWTFGFCRHDPKSETALVILSYLPWHESFYKLLNCISNLTKYSNKSNNLWPFLESVYNSKLPIKGCDLKINNDNGEELFVCQSPNPFQLPSIPENRNLTEYYNAVDSQNMIIIFASMLFERRIIFTSKKLYRLSACVQSANAILYPMNWEHIFIPVLPQTHTDVLLAPMPYLIGLPYTLFQNLQRNDLGEVVILDADNNTIETPFDDLENLPSEVVSTLKRQLRNKGTLLGDGVSRAFLRALVQLIGGYRDGLKRRPEEPITFNKDAFIESRSTNMQPFLRKILEVQIFQQFIEKRLEMLNSGLGCSDEFEKEMHNYSEKSSNRLKQQFRECTSTVSDAFKTVKNVANPTVKNALKTVREQGKDVRLVYKGLRTKLNINNKNPRTKIPLPNSAPSSPSMQRRPLRVNTSGFPTASASYRKETLNGIQRLNTTQSLLNDSQSSPPPELNMDLMEDLKDVIFSKFSRNSTPSSLMNFDTSSTEHDWHDSVSSTNEVFGTSYGSAPIECPMNTKDLIRLDSSSVIDDFDPLKSPVNNNGLTPGVGLSNPLYQYFIPLSNTQSETKNNNELLSEYGLNFDSLSFSDQPGSSMLPNQSSIPPLPPKNANFKSNWMKFE